MTIAIGILAAGGSVIAADRQQTEGGLKSDQGKIAAAWVAGRGSIASSGAGNGPYLDAIAQELSAWFSSENGPSSNDALGDELRKKHEAFYRRYVLPFAKYAEYERPDYELLVVGSTTRSFDTIWTSHKLIVNKEELFAAVGSGATTAKALLAKFYVPNLPLEIAISLAVYVVYQVKRTVDGVGLETDVVELRNHVPLFVSRTQIQAMEAQFRSYEDLETSNLYYCLGGDPAHEAFIFGNTADREAREKAIRNFFEKLNDERSRTHPLPKPPTTEEIRERIRKAQGS